MSLGRVTCWLVPGSSAWRRLVPFGEGMIAGAEAAGRLHACIKRATAPPAHLRLRALAGAWWWVGRAVHRGRPIEPRHGTKKATDTAANNDVQDRIEAQTDLHLHGGLWSRPHLIPDLPHALQIKFACVGSGHRQSPLRIRTLAAIAWRSSAFSHPSHLSLSLLALLQCDAAGSSVVHACTTTTSRQQELYIQPRRADVHTSCS